MTRTIDVTPTWEAEVEIYIAAIEYGTDKGKDSEKAELRRMARMLDDNAKNG